MISTLHQTKISIVKILSQLHWRPIGSYPSDDPHTKKSTGQGKSEL